MNWLPTNYLPRYLAVVGLRSSGRSSGSSCFQGRRYRDGYIFTQTCRYSHDAKDVKIQKQVQSTEYGDIGGHQTG